MIRYKIDVFDALKRAGFTGYTARKTGILSQSTMQKIKNEDATLTLENINRVCALLDMQPKDIIEYIPTDADREMVRKCTNKKDEN